MTVFLSIHQKFNLHIFCKDWFTIPAFKILIKHRSGKRENQIREKIIC